MQRTARNLFIFLILLISGLSLNAQKIVYSEYDRDDTRKMDFEIIGKIGGNYLIYKNTRSKVWITVYDNELQQLDKVEQDFLPSSDKLINVDFFPYGDFAYMIYQYQKKNVVYCMATRINGNGRNIGEPLELDTTHIGFNSSNKIYNVVTSEDRSRICAFKINSHNRRLFLMSTLLFDDKLQLKKITRLEIPMEERNENLGDFTLNNDGDLVFTRFFRGNNDNIMRASLMVKYAEADKIMEQPLEMSKIALDELHVKVDNVNKRFFLTSFYSPERRASIEGLYFFCWDKASNKMLYEKTLPISEEIRQEVKGEASIKTAFDDFFIRNFIFRRDGGFILGSESFYTTSRFNNWNRWDYLYGTPYNNLYYNNNYYNPYYNNSYYNSRFGSTQSVRYHADNLAVFAFNGKGEMEWHNVIGKAQFNDESDDMISYSVVNTGDALHFLTNMQERRNNLLTDYSIVADGTLNRNPTLKNLDRGYDFLPKYGKQVSSRVMIIPCIYRNYICFAKIDYNLAN
ncbi:MAG: hypothetical protein IPQ08_00715 [Chitinophagaceae bacterium]|nr:hypothetical protein [Chitinophagaceae bacterium]